MLHAKWPRRLAAGLRSISEMERKTQADTVASLCIFFTFGRLRQTLFDTAYGNQDATLALHLAHAG